MCIHSSPILGIMSFLGTSTMQTFGRRRMYGFIGLLIFFLLISFYHYDYQFGNTRKKPVPVSRTQLLRSKWIVVTSIFPPTMQIRTLSRIPGWQLLVVGDLKTPLDWTCPNVILLNVTRQHELGYNILKLLPWNSYTRKAIGYLYAIQHGAKFIYDTDDDNAPNDPSTFENNFILKNVTRGLVTRNISFVSNPYAHFGQRTVWPRGYPLDQLSQPRNNSYTTCPMRTPIIQQGLVNGDPDVDAIFRRTRRYMNLNIQFDSRAPPMIFPESVLAPFNSQNTMFHYDAFWSLILPISVTFRVTDIWRAYWAQALLWKIGGHVGFYPPHTTQIRNAHVYQKDFQDEDKLYQQSESLTRFLSTWECSNKADLYQCMLELTQNMATRKYWETSELELMNAWIADLKDVGYKKPELRSRQPCLEGEVQSVAVFSGVDLSVPEDLHRSSLREFCNLTAKKLKPSVKFPNHLLIVIFNLPHYENIWLLDLVYRPHYPNILYCGGMEDFSRLTNLLKSSRFVDAGVRDISFVRTRHISKGYLLYECVLRAIDMNYDVSGYLAVGDDILLNFWHYTKLSSDEMWVQNEINYRNMLIPLELQPDASWWIFWKPLNNSILKLFPTIQNSTNPLVQDFWRRREAFGLNSTTIGFTMSDLFYVPACKEEMYYAVGTLLWKMKVFLELSTTLLSEGISGPNNTVHLQGTAVWNQDRERKPFKYFRANEPYLHPVKLNRVQSEEPLRQEYCRQYISRIIG